MSLVYLLNSPRLIEVENLASYREAARTEYALAAVKPITNMYKYVANKKLCVGLEKRLAKYWEWLITDEIVVNDLTRDTQLPDMVEILSKKTRRNYFFRQQSR